MLFVYGTLRSGCDNEFARLLQTNGELVTKGRLRGTLYRIAHYPGWVEDSAGWVHGEVWNVAPAIIQKLDDYEGAEYSRVQRAIETDQGSLECHVYQYVAPVKDKQCISSGDWLVQ